MKSIYDVCILGAGLAGLHTAIELLEAGFSVCVIDPNSIAGGASGTPVGLANPATGRFANRSWEADKSMELLSKRLDEISGESGQQFHRKTGVLRPAQSEKIAARMQENVSKNDWMANTVFWKTKTEIEEMQPGLNSVGGGVWVANGLTISIPTYLQALYDYLSSKGVRFELAKPYTLKETNEWNINFTNDEQIVAKKLIVAAGYSSKNIDVTQHLPFHAVKGQTAILHSKKPISFEHAVSAQGYFSKIDDNHFILGSTYEHNFEHTQPDEQGLEFMLTRFKNVFPELASNSTVQSQWAGVRASTPDRMPIIGSIRNNLLVFAGLGSKGLLYSAFGAKLLSKHIEHGDMIPDIVNVQRFTT